LEYSGNAIYDYVKEKKLRYYFSTDHTWLLVYGDTTSIPKIMVFANRVNNLSNKCSFEELNAFNKAYNISKYLNLPFLYVRFMVNSMMINIWEEKVGKWREVTYDQLRDIYELYGVVQPGTAKKPVNQYVSSPYHDWQRQNLGTITVTDFDLVKYVDNDIKKVVELKRSKIDINLWNPFHNDFANFALLINTIIGSHKNIKFCLYYNVMKAGIAGMRVEDISKIKVFDFIIPSTMISRDEVQFKLRGIYSLEQLFDER